MVNGWRENRQDSFLLRKVPSRIANRLMLGLQWQPGGRTLNAGLRWERTPRSLSNMEIRRLFRSIVEVLHDAIKHRGSTLSDQQYVDVFGKPGEYQEHHKVYARDGETCRRCRSVLVRERTGGRTTYFCPSCQV